MRAAKRVPALSTVIAVTGSGAWWAAVPMTKPNTAMTMQEMAGTLLKPSAMTACVAPRPIAAIEKTQADAERALRATSSRFLHVVTA